MKRAVQIAAICVLLVSAGQTLRAAPVFAMDDQGSGGDVGSGGDPGSAGGTGSGGAVGGGVSGRDDQAPGQDLSQLEAAAFGRNAGPRMLDEGIAVGRPLSDWERWNLEAPVVGEQPVLDPKLQAKAAAYVAIGLGAMAAGRCGAPCGYAAAGFAALAQLLNDIDPKVEPQSASGIGISADPRDHPSSEHENGSNSGRDLGKPSPRLRTGTANSSNSVPQSASNNGSAGGGRGCVCKESGGGLDGNNLNTTGSTNGSNGSGDTHEHEGHDR